MRIKSNISIDKTTHELKKYMDFLGITDWRLATMSHGEGVGLVFQMDGVHYLIKSEKQLIYKDRISLEKNARAILHIVQARVNEMRKGVETLESMFTGFVNWVTTPKLPPHIDMALQQRGIDMMLPAPKNNQQALEEL
jgi:hypothetical protein